MRKRAAALLGGIWRHRWIRLGLLSVVVIVALASGVWTLGATGGVIVRDSDDCPRSIGALSSADWLDLVRVEGATYERVEPPPDDAHVERPRLGERVAVVRCNVADVHRAGYDLRNGEATILAPGTPLHALVDTHRSFRIVAMDNGAPAVYEHRRSDAATGAELLPFPTEAVVRVAFLSAEDGTTVVGRITEPSEVSAFVDMLKSSAVDSHAARDLPEGPRNFVALRLAHEPPVTLVVYPEQALTTDGLRLPDAVLNRLPPPS